MNLSLKQELILKETLVKNGVNNQIDMCIEECSELIQALCKYKRGRQHNVEEEMADVFIMMTQMRLVFNQIEIQRIINLKVNTLKDKIQDE